MCRAQKEEVEIPNHPQQEALICPSPRFDTSQEIIEAVINSSAEKTSFPNFSANKNDVVKEDSMYLKPPKNVRRHRKHSTNSQASTAKTVSSTDLEEVTALDRIEISEGQDSVKYLRT
uniref:Ovule protein n=1 Tax=Rhabditophanes sp. KR3021 TaxID=114890 RepID=A0AC35U9E2_9BILA